MVAVSPYSLVGISIKSTNRLLTAWRRYGLPPSNLAG